MLKARQKFVILIAKGEFTCICGYSLGAKSDIQVRQHSRPSVWISLIAIKYTGQNFLNGKKYIVDMAEYNLNGTCAYVACC